MRPVASLPPQPAGAQQEWRDGGILKNCLNRGKGRESKEKAVKLHEGKDFLKN